MKNKEKPKPQIQRLDKNKWIPGHFNILLYIIIYIVVGLMNQIVIANLIALK